MALESWLGQLQHHQPLVMTSQPNTSGSSLCFCSSQTRVTHVPRNVTLYLRQTMPLFRCKPCGSSPVSSESREESSIHTPFSSAALPSPPTSGTARHLLTCCWGSLNPSDIFCTRALSSGKSLPLILILCPLIVWKVLLL